MINFIKNFRADEDGAVTVDWVVLTAAVVGLGVVAVGTVRTSVGTLATNIATGVTDTDVGAPEEPAAPVVP
ncbi:hypothetical protein ACEWPL_005060 [Roseovarius sp. S1116L3]|uniref:hypothetical protein n=1 Tax=Roseovarius roseus TaxID=3342636 RepID=UPI00372C259E